MEGPDGCGKSTQSKLLADSLRKNGFQVVHTREPGGTSFAENLRRIILNPKYPIVPLAELFLYEASRAQHTEEIIRPALKSGKIVVSERYADATVAYQGYGRKLHIPSIHKLNEVATGGLVPDLTIVLDIDVTEGLRRARENKKGKSKGKGDRLERENSSFHQRVRRGYFALAKREPKRIKIVSARGSIDEVHQKVWNIVIRKIKSNGTEFF